MSRTAALRKRIEELESENELLKERIQFLTEGREHPDFCSSCVVLRLRKEASTSERIKCFQRRIKC